MKAKQTAGRRDEWTDNNGSVMEWPEKTGQMVGGGKGK
jgi:hypothetical protein